MAAKRDEREQHRGEPRELEREHPAKGSEEVSEHQERGHYSIGLHDLGDLSELRERYRDHRVPPEYKPR
jgi:hypothetical protein